MAKYTGTSTQDADFESEAWAANDQRLGGKRKGTTFRNFG